MIYQHGILHCRKEDLAVIDRSFIVGIRENSFGVEVMIRKKDAFMKQYRQLSVDRASLEEIMLFVNRGKESI